MHCAPMERAMQRKGSRSTTSRATSSPTEILMAHVKTFLVTRVYSSTISAR